MVRFELPVLIPIKHDAKKLSSAFKLATASTIERFFYFIFEIILFGYRLHRIHLYTTIRESNELLPKARLNSFEAAFPVCSKRASNQYFMKKLNDVTKRRPDFRLKSSSAVILMTFKSKKVIPTKTFEKMLSRGSTRANAGLELDNFTRSTLADAIGVYSYLLPPVEVHPEVKNYLTAFARHLSIQTRLAKSEEEHSILIKEQYKIEGLLSISLEF